MQQRVFSIVQVRLISKLGTVALGLSLVAAALVQPGRAATPSPCDSCECSESLCCDEPCEPWISIRAGALTLHRSDNAEFGLLTNQATGETLLTTTDINPGWTAGAELDVILRLTHDWDFEFDWFSLGNWSRQHTADIGGVVVQPIGVPLTSATLGSSSELHNFEFNLRRRVTEYLSVLAGFRYFELDDTLTIHYEDSVSSVAEDAQVTARNRMYGFQLGADATLWQRGPWGLDAWAKAGIFGNAARSSADVVFTGFPVVLPPLRAAESNAAFLGDLGLRASYRFGEHVQVYGGYRVMFIDGVALGVDQIESVSTFFSGGPAQIAADGSPFYHGAELGLTFTF